MEIRSFKFDLVIPLKCQGSSQVVHLHALASFTMWLSPIWLAFVLPHSPEQTKAYHFILKCKGIFSVFHKRGHAIRKKLASPFNICITSAPVPCQLLWPVEKRLNSWSQSLPVSWSPVTEASHSPLKFLLPSQKCLLTLTLLIAQGDGSSPTLFFFTLCIYHVCLENFPEPLGLTSPKTQVPCRSFWFLLWPSVYLPTPLLELFLHLSTPVFSEYLFPNPFCLPQSLVMPVFCNSLTAYRSFSTTLFH